MGYESMGPVVSVLAALKKHFPVTEKPPTTKTIVPEAPMTAVIEALDSSEIGVFCLMPCNPEAEGAACTKAANYRADCKVEALDLAVARITLSPPASSKSGINVGVEKLITARDSANSPGDNHLLKFSLPDSGKLKKGKYRLSPELIAEGKNIELLLS